MAKLPPFGKEMREKEFTLKEGVTFVNHGSYGAVPRRVQEERKRIIDVMNSHPDLWFRRNVKLIKEGENYSAEIFKASSEKHIVTESTTAEIWDHGNRRQKLDQARQCIAEFVHADPEDLVLVDNVTTGINSVLKSIKLDPDDVILCTDYTYYAVKNTCEATSELNHMKGVKTDFLALKFPISSEDEVVEMYREYLKNNSKVKIAVLDHISSQSAVKMPIEKLIPLCKEFGVLTVIDGAHGPGQVPLKLRELGADFYAGNIYKWLYTPQGSAILYVSKKHQQWVRPAVTSHGHRTNFHYDFFCQGTRDDSPLYVIPEAIQFYKDLGGYEKIHGYIDDMLSSATKLLTETWKTEKLPVPKSMEAPFMKMVELPRLEDLASFDDGERKIIENIIHHNVVVTLTAVGGKPYVRLSGNVYNTPNDYKKLCDLICQQML